MCASFAAKAIAACRSYLTRRRGWATIEKDCASVRKRGAYTMPTYMLAFVVALFVTYLLTPQVMKLAVKAGAMDAPDARKVHTSPIPRMGGLAIFAGFVFAVLASMHVSREILGLLIGGTVIVMVGIVDDMKPLSARVKLIGQIAAALVMVGFNVRIDWLSNPFGEEMLYLEMFSVPFTVLFTVSMINVVNLIDGLDGLAGGLLAISFSAFGVIALLQGNSLLAGFCFTVVGALLSYLWFNIYPARFFMGDVGSFAFGVSLGVVAMLTDSLLLLPVIGLLFVVEAGSSLIQIASKKFFGKKIFLSAPIHHHLEAIGWPETKVTMRFWVIACVMAALGILLAVAGGHIA